MEKDLKKFITEFSNNFSELYVETFLLRYHSEFDINNLELVFKVCYEETMQKINKYFLQRL